MNEPTDQTLERIAGDILRQVVCSCGGYRHHGVDWMPEGSGEGKSVAFSFLRELYRAGYRAGIQKGRDDREYEIGRA